MIPAPTRPRALLSRGLYACSLSMLLAACITEPRLQGDAIQNATSIRVSNPQHQGSEAREITDRDLLQTVLGLVSQYNSWHVRPECFEGGCADLRIEWLANGIPIQTIYLCYNSSVARLGEPGPESTCGRD